MLTVKPEKNPKVVKALFEKNGIHYTPDCGAVLAKEGEKTLGCGLFAMKDGVVTVRYLEPLNDFLLADGILRSTLHVALCNGATDAYYDNFELEVFLEKDRFIKNKTLKQLEIEKLFSSCCSCEKKG